MERIKGTVGVRPRRPGARDASVYTEIVSTDAGSEKIRFLPIGGLLPGRNPRITD